jgi:hypothetical protein
VDVGASSPSQNSYFYFNKLYTANPLVAHLRILVNSVGAVPVIGFRTFNPGSTFINFGNVECYTYINLLTGAITSNYPSHTATSYNGFTTAVAAGEIIDLYFENIYDLETTLKVVRTSPGIGEISATTLTWNVSTSVAANIYYLATILGDGNYTILKNEVYCTEQLRPKFVVVGDSLMSGASINFTDTIIGKFKSKVPYTAVNFSAPGCLLAGMQAILQDVIIANPEIVFFDNALDALFYGAINPGNPNHATWDINFKKFVNSIEGAGMRPILLLSPNSFLYTNATLALFKTYWQTNFPGRDYVEIAPSDVHFDITGFHYNGVTNGIIADGLIELL